MAGEIAFHYLPWQALPQDRRHGTDAAIDKIRQTINRKASIEPTQGGSGDSWAAEASPSPWIDRRQNAIGFSRPPITMALSSNTARQWVGGASAVGAFYKVQLVDYASISGIAAYWPETDYVLYDYRFWFVGSAEGLALSENPNYPTESWPFTPDQVVLDFWADPWSSLFRRARSPSFLPPAQWAGVMPLSKASTDAPLSTPPAITSRPEALIDNFASDWFHDSFRWYELRTAIWTGFNSSTGWQGKYWSEDIELPVYQASQYLIIPKWDSDMVDDLADAYIMAMQDGTSYGPSTTLVDYQPPSNYGTYMQSIYIHFVSISGTYFNWINSGKFCYWLSWPDVRGVRVSGPMSAGGTIYWRPLTRAPSMIGVAAVDLVTDDIPAGPDQFEDQMFKAFLITAADYEDTASWTELGAWADSSPDPLDELITVGTQPTYGQLVMLKIDPPDQSIDVEIFMNPHRWPNSVRAAEGLIPGFVHADQRPP